MDADLLRQPRHKTLVKGADIKDARFPVQQPNTLHKIEFLPDREARPLRDMFIRRNFREQHQLRCRLQVIPLCGFPECLDPADQEG